ncbi:MULTISPECIES: helix-turn-helix transcriptional regulator [unclassified Clostridioides]|uniref:helix-turn-helix transcriptional regulator n=1 Tax=unclassified Clostridioides TaxID=2635829 RepID=UPI001D1033A3|nr:YafY family transcriptional regulator [Clostridioides sp. ZZV14-6153]MCC0720683.1 YafY family transcriptional regulator [Clostridioides sp. ZZV14-6105]MCC0725088.1 YafY family transcriptional regulator [Clostridioides sp. ZZV14-6045]MCC0732111.1 YafY family transcriptional regulator [Clostridioides sp. ZZV14-6048]MCC0735104.1 YafY family transcriptional regulator [Clostridioides sp. ZZV14-6009]MCC0750260.1 YafY family transcriptional regulator [Clostridioides sp. ZZV13-5731]
MSKAERLIELIITINAKRNFTLRELSEEFCVSKRTILRDLQALESMGFPLYSETGATGGYHMLKERILPPITFSESEAKAIFFAYQSLAFYSDLPFEQERVSVLKKFLNCLPADVQHNITQIQNKIVFWTPDRHCSSPLLKELFNIITNNSALTVQYSSNKNQSIRTIIPVGLYAMNGLWYCPAYCLKSKSIREFRVDRIEKIVNIENITSSKYSIPNSIHEYLENLEVAKDYHIKIQLTDIGVKRCETEFLLAKGLTIFPNGGYIDMYISKTTLNWVAEYFLSFGKEATVLEPIELKTLIKSKVQELYNHYCKINTEM